MKLYCILATWEDGTEKEFFTDEDNLEKLIEQFFHTNKMMYSYNVSAWICKAEICDLGFIQKTELICPIDFYGSLKLKLA